jgi:PhnB protein
MTGLRHTGMRRETVGHQYQHQEQSMQMNPYLTFKGQCEAAFKFYEKVLGGKIVAMMPHEGTPAADHVPAEWRGKIMHARLVLDDDRVLMGSDAPPGMQEEMKGFSVTLGVDKPAEAERIFHALAEDGTVRMPIQETFWATRFGMLTDRFGTPWMINCEKAAA